MDISDTFLVDTDVKRDAESMVRSSETVTYITELLVELQTIAKFSGQSELSLDLLAVISKHAGESVKAA